MSVLAEPVSAAPGFSIRLLQVDRELLEAIPEVERQLAERVVVATRHHLPPGPWSPESLLDGETRLNQVLLLEGTVVRDVVLAGRPSGHLFGPGDVLRPWRAIDTILASTTRWTCGTGGASIAVLDDRFLRAARKWPGLSAVMQERLAYQLDSFTLRTAIAGLPRTGQRVLALLWQLADRWGTVTPAGVVVRLELTHELIGRLVGSRRPTVSLALQALAADGLLTRADNGAWCLAHDSYMALDWVGDRLLEAADTADVVAAR